jgi:ATP-dependent DNA helicase RecG
MLVEGADRFGLAQLHQFRGRVGRGEHQSYCILLSENPSEEAQERLGLMETIYDGFRLAEEDLRLRGPGEYFGTRQTGMPDLKVARLSDIDLIERARAEAARLLEADASLARPEHRLLERQVSHLWERVTAEVS